MQNLGKTNDFPRGKLNEHDEGGLRVAICAKDKTVIIDFGTQISWIGMDRAGALDFAKCIIEKANAIPAATV